MEVSNPLEMVLATSATLGYNRIKEATVSNYNDAINDIHPL